MAIPISEPELRREAIRRRLQGERPCDICRDLGRSRRWLERWWARYLADPSADVRDRPHVAHRVANRTPDSVREAILRLRRAFEKADTPRTRFGLIGRRAIRAELTRLGTEPLPSLSTIQRVLSGHGLTRRGDSGEPAYYPGPVACRPDCIHATDIITRRLRGGSVVQNFHTVDEVTHAVVMSQFAAKTSALACQHVLKSWEILGLPHMQKMDNEHPFSGGQTHPRVIGRLVRLCLFVGVEPLFVPYYEPKRNGWVEGFHAVWVKGFWSRYEFASLEDVQRQSTSFSRWYATRYVPPAIEPDTPEQRRHGVRPLLLTQRRRALIPERVPITAGRIHFLRKVDAEGRVVLLNEVWPVAQRLAGQYVWAMVETAQQRLTFWHKAGDDARWRRVGSRRFPLPEPAQPLLLAFRRNCDRSAEHGPPLDSADSMPQIR
jgi:putative transposase